MNPIRINAFKILKKASTKITASYTELSEKKPYHLRIKTANVVFYTAFLQERIFLKDFSHSNIIFLIGPEGKVRHRLVGLKKDPAPLKKQLKKLVDGS